MFCLEELTQEELISWIRENVQVLDEHSVLALLEAPYIDLFKIGKLNYYPSNINWKCFGEKAEAYCKEKNLNYYIKDSLRAEMEKGV